MPVRAVFRHFAAFLVLLPGAIAAQPSQVVRIGGEDDPRESLLEPWDVQMISGRIVVLEKEAPFLKLFTLDGRLVQTVGRSGSGPGEMRYAAAMLYMPATQRLLVFDVQNARAVEFAVGDSLTFTRSLATPLHVGGACMMGQRLFLAAYSSQGIAHEVVPARNELRILRSFGTPTASHPLAEHPIFRDYAGSGSLHCDVASNRLWLASRVVGVLHRLAADGTSQRTDPIAGFQPVIMEAAPGGGFTQRMPESGVFDHAVVFREAPDGARLIIGRADAEHSGGGDYATFREVRVGRDGTQRPSASSPWFLVGQAQGSTVCYRTAPAPTIEIVRTAGCPAR